jgi:hypothetical protein
MPEGPVLRFSQHAGVAQHAAKRHFCVYRCVGENMAFEDTPAIRELIRTKLCTYMAGPPPRGPYAIETEIRKNKAVLGGTVSHDTIERCRKGEEERRPGKLRVLYTYLAFREAIFDEDLNFPKAIADPIYRLLEHFFGVREHDRDLCTLLDGTYRLFFRAEDINESVVVGAVSFSRNALTQAFEVKELQRSRQPRRVERWSGYYFARQERIVMVLRGQGSILRDTPKFYVLNTPHADDSDGGDNCNGNGNGNGEVVTEIGGRMLKLGSGGSNRSAFSAKVLLRRYADAFEECDVVPLSTVAPDILNEI